MNEKQPKMDSAEWVKRRYILIAKMRKKWRWSAWRILPLPILAFVATGTYLWLVGIPDALLRAVGHVLTVMIFILLGPVIRNWWFTRERERMGITDASEQEPPSVLGL